MTTTGIAVVDASLALEWVLTEEDSEAALDLLTTWQQDAIQPIVPSWFACEVANVLYRFVLNGNLSVADAQELHRAVTAIVVVAGDEPADAAHALELAHQAGQKQTYDAQYAALAERLGCELWTADDRFRDAVVPVAPRVHALSELQHGSGATP